VTLKYDHLTGQRFAWGLHDCFSLTRAFFDDNFGLKIKNYARPTDWRSDEIDLIRRLYEREGFEMITTWKIKDLRPADVLCIAIGERNPNHFAIVTDHDTIVHHIYGKMSEEEPLRDFWLNHTCFILRHPSVPDLRPVYPDITIAELLNARNAPPSQ
jgi:cell wall-associated NlpC family hydrolase